MEYIDVFDENNNQIGQIKEKQKAHEDGNFHSPILIAGIYLEQGI